MNTGTLEHNTNDPEQLEHRPRELMDARELLSVYPYKFDSNWFGEGEWDDDSDDSDDSGDKEENQHIISIYIIVKLLTKKLEDEHIPYRRYDNQMFHNSVNRDDIFEFEGQNWSIKMTHTDALYGQLTHYIEAPFLQKIYTCYEYMDLEDDEDNTIIHEGTWTKKFKSTPYFYDLELTSTDFTIESFVDHIVAAIKEQISNMINVKNAAKLN